MKKIKLSELLEFGKQDYNSLKLDNKIKEKILEKTIYKKSIFSSILKYSAVFTSFAIFVIVWFVFYQNMQYNENKLINNTEELIEKNNIWIQTKKQENYDIWWGIGWFWLQRATTIGVAGSIAENAWDEWYDVAEKVLISVNIIWMIVIIINLTIFVYLWIVSLLFKTKNNKYKKRKKMLKIVSIIIVITILIMIINLLVYYKLEL